MILMSFYSRIHSTLSNQVKRWWSGNRLRETLSAARGAELEQSALRVLIGGIGFRIGRVYLHACQLMGIVGFALVMSLSPFWSKHLAIDVAFLIILAIPPFYVGFLTERIKGERKRADEANQAKGRFVANVSH